MRKNFVAASVAAVIATGLAVGIAYAGPMAPATVDGDTVETNDYVTPTSFYINPTAPLFGFTSNGVNFPAGVSDYRFDFCVDAEKVSGYADDAMLTAEMTVNLNTSNYYPALAYKPGIEARSTVCQSALVPISQQGSGSTFNVKFLATTSVGGAFYIRNYQSHVQVTALTD